MSERGHYGRNGVSRIGQSPQPHTIYVEHKQSSSTGAWIVGALAAGGALLWARHQSRQMEAIYKTSGVPYQTFTAGLRESARSIPARAKETFRSFRSTPAPAPAAAIAAEPAHSTRARSRAR